MGPGLGSTFENHFTIANVDFVVIKAWRPSPSVKQCDVFHSIVSGHYNSTSEFE